MRNKIATDNKWIKHQAGFSFIEMTIVLAILAIGATTAMRIASNKMEETVTTRTVADLSIAAEAAYECYVEGDCVSRTDRGWNPDKNDLTVFEALELSLPGNFPDHYQFFVQPPEAEGDPSKKALIKVEMRDKKQAQRVARAFGSSADAEGKDVVLTLRIPGTEQAFSSAIEKTKRDVKEEIKSEDFAFDKEVSAATLIVSGEKITPEMVEWLRNNTVCPNGKGEGEKWRSNIPTEGWFNHICESGRVSRTLITHCSNGKRVGEVWDHRHWKGGWPARRFYHAYKRCNTNGTVTSGNKVRGH